MEFIMKTLLSIAAFTFIITTISDQSYAPTDYHEISIYVNGAEYQPNIENVEIEPVVEVPEIDPVELECLALNIYHEARGESQAGKLAVAHVTLNRVEHYKYPDTICGVVTQGRHYVNWKGNTMPVKHKCQFSWYCDGRSDTVQDDSAWAQSIDLAFDVIMGITTDNTHGATHYYNPNKADPYWAEQYAMTAQHGNHVFMTMVY